VALVTEKVTMAFNSHLKEQKLTYFQHLGRALKMAFKAGIAADILFIHAFFPFIFGSYFSKYIKRTYKKQEDYYKG